MHNMLNRRFGMVNRTQKKSAFTLIELLVVIAIISLLVSILLPSLKKAKDLARQMECSVQLRNIYMGFTLYAEDGNGFIQGPWRSTNEHWFNDLQSYYDTLGQRSDWIKMNICPFQEPAGTLCYAMNRKLSPNGFSSPFEFVKSDSTSTAARIFLCDFRSREVIVAPASWGASGFYTRDPNSERLRHGESLNVLFYDGHVNPVVDLDDESIIW